jgi:hypothetical protein
MRKAMSRIPREEHTATASEREGPMPLPTSEVLPGYKSGFSSLDSPLTPTSKTGFSSPVLGSEFYSIPASRQVETDFGIEEVNVRVNKYYPGNRNYQNAKHEPYGWEQDKFPKYPEIMDKSSRPDSVPSTSGTQKITNMDNDVKPAVIPEPSFKVELTARALVGGFHVKNTMKQQLKTIFRNARPEDDRMFAAEGNNFDYRSKINPHVMPMPMIQAAMSAARGGTERDHFNLRSNFSGVDESKFLNYDVHSQFNRRKWKEEVAKQDQINQDMWRREEEEREERRQQLHAAREVLDEAIGFIEGLEMEQQKQNLDFFSANGWS